MAIQPYNRITAIGRHIFNLGNLWIVLSALLIHAYIVLFMLPIREHEPNSFLRLKELTGIAGLIDGHRSIVYCLIVAMLVLLRRYLPIKDWLSTLFDSAPVQKVVSWFGVDRTRTNLIIFFCVGTLLVVLPHIVLVVIGALTMFGCVYALSEHERSKHSNDLKKYLSGEAKVGLWCRDQLMQQTEPGVFEITVLISATLLTSSFAKHRELFIDGVQTLNRVQITEPQERKGFPTSRYLGGLIPPSTSQVLGVQKALDLFGQILDRKIVLQDGPIGIQLKCRLSSDVNLRESQAHFCLPNQSLEIEECQVLPTLEHRI